MTLDSLRLPITSYLEKFFDHFFCRYLPPFNLFFSHHGNKLPPTMRFRLNPGILIMINYS
jgi:hypothetical protein